MHRLFWEVEYHFYSFRERFWMWLAWHLPKLLVTWASVRMISHATTGAYSDTVVPELSVMDALKRWETA